MIGRKHCGKAVHMLEHFGDCIVCQVITIQHVGPVFFMKFLQWFY